MNFSLNKKTIGPAAFGIIGLLLVGFSYFVGSVYLKNQKQTETLNKINSYESKIKNQNINLTDNLAENVIRKVAETNLNSSGVGAVKIPDQSSITEAIENSLKNFNPESVKPSINDKDIKISSDNSREAVSAYFKKFQEILNSFSENNIKEDTTLANALASIIFSYEKMISSFYALEVPSEIASFHKEEISLLSAKLIVLKQLRGYEKDPLLTLLAVKSDEYLDSKFVELKDSINNYLIKNNVVF